MVTYKTTQILRVLLGYPDETQNFEKLGIYGIAQTRRSIKTQLTVQLTLTEYGGSEKSSVAHHILEKKLSRCEFRKTN